MTGYEAGFLVQNRGQRLFLVCCVEEPSAREMLRGVLPRLGLQEGQDFQVILFQGKQDLEKQLELRLRAWQRPNSVFLVLRDQDSGDCATVKQSLMWKLVASGQKGLVRIACRELESFYLGDLAAVEAGLGLSGLAQQQQGRKFREPDRLNNAKQELKQLTKQGYQEVAGSRAIAPLLNLDPPVNRSRSFQVLLEGIAQLLALDLSTLLEN
ncbi:DUF4276 family protein [Prochlorothrix hollandica]|uniref:DUF4276 family protein n=1 Tax=Prochlorothrix hollandica PCC 9006 = CALU 1027 TaxID=317619 RepID=A0A0M2PZQ9_PROHO|nr:hypothetical protein PROH_10800 [Prochlorothrix hollandica PCC 9006 = CALU 1027]